MMRCGSIKKTHGGAKTDYKKEKWYKWHQKRVMDFTPRVRETIETKKHCMHTKMCGADITIKEEQAVYTCGAIQLMTSAVAIIALSATL